MTSLDALAAQIVAAQAAAAPATATAWAPVAAQAAAPIGSPAAAAPTGWTSTPAAVAGAVDGAGGLTMEEAILAAMAQQQFAAPAEPSTAAVQAATPPEAAPVQAAAASIPSAIAGYAAATGRAVATVAGSGVSHARRVGSEIWAGIRNPRAVHVSQVPSKYNPTPAAGNKDCGPTSVVMALKLLGMSLPGVAANASPQRLINRVRELSGNTPNTASTTNLELERALRTAGARIEEVRDLEAVKESVLAGRPVILNGNPRNPGAYGPSFSAKQMTPYDGPHWITVSGYDESSHKFIINDPLSKVGPVKVSEAQLDAYRGGSMGIEVSV